MAKLINGSKTEITARILREGKEQDVKISPAKDAVDGQYRIGLWVRDSTAGIGTVTYYDEKNQSFATLGHAIADADTNTNLLLKEGEIVEADVMGIQKGETGAPGELLGALVTDSAALGKITSNTEYGLYGKAYAKMESETYPNGIKVGWQDGVHTGKAQILCMLDDGILQAYDCEIVR
ncbi:MAG: SpoIVB peptidase S55 domain-containing protein [Christensenellales bacterium]